MSQQGFLVWHTRSPRLRAEMILQKLPKLLGMEYADFVHRTDRIVYGPQDGDWASDCVATDVLAADLVRLYVPGTTLKIDAESALFGDRIESALSKSVPESIRGDFMPNRPFVRIGGHFFIDAADDTETAVPYTAMVGCWGYTTPNDTETMYKLVLASSELKIETNHLEGLLGPLTRSLYFSF